MLFPHFHKVLIALAIGLFIAAIGIFKLTTNANYLVYFDQNNALVNTYLDKQRDFNLNESLILVLRSKDGNKLTQDKAFYKLSNALVKSIQQLPQVHKVNSFLTELRWHNNLFTNTQNPSNNRFLAKDETTALIYIDAAIADNKSAKNILNFNNQILALAQESYLLASKKDNISFYLSGALGLNNAYISTVRHDLKFFIPFLFSSLFILLYVFLKSIKITLALLAIGVISTLASFGVIGWLGYPLASINIFTPIMIIGLSVVTNMHNTLAFFQRIADNELKSSALEQSFKENLVPVTMSCLTTALGFLFLLNSSSPPVIVTGIASALGIVFSLALSLTLLQKMLFLNAPATNIAQQCLAVTLFKKKIWLKRGNKKTILIAAFSFFILGLLGLSKLSINDNVYHYFPENYDFRKSITIVDNQFNGIASIDYVIGKQVGGSPINSSSNWTEQQWTLLKKFVAKINQLPNIKSIYPTESFLNSENFAQFKQSKNKSKSAFYTYFNDTNTVNDQKIRIQVRFKQMSSKKILALDLSILKIASTFNIMLNTHNKAALLTKNNLSISKGTSPDILFANLGYNNAYSMFSSLLIALTLISLVTGYLLKSWKLCALVFICNFLPLTIAYGLLGFSGGYLSLGSTVVIGMIIGIIVDDTLHLLFKYSKFRAKKPHFSHAQANQKSVTDALMMLHKKVFPAVIISSFIIIIALSIGLVSDFKPTFEISFFSILVIFLALIIDIFVIPALLSTSWMNRKPNLKDEGF